PGASIRERQAALVGAARVRRQIAAAVRRADLQPGEAIERALEDQVRERDGGLERVADHVLQQAVSLESTRDLDRHAAALGVTQDEHAEPLGLGPERMALRVAQLLPLAAASD